jgi:hypothetical protein
LSVVLFTLPASAWLALKRPAAITSPSSRGRHILMIMHVAQDWWVWSQGGSIWLLRGPRAGVCVGVCTGVWLRGGVLAGSARAAGTGRRSWCSASGGRRQRQLRLCRPWQRRRMMAMGW